METVGSPCSTFETLKRVTVALSAMSCIDRCLRFRASIICSPMSCNCCVKALGIIFPNVFLLIIVIYRMQNYNKMFNITNIFEKIFA